MVFVTIHYLAVSAILNAYDVPAGDARRLRVHPELRGLVPGPHKIWLANLALLKAIVSTGAYFQKDSSLSKAEIEIVTNVITGRWLAAYADYEHEKIGVA